jgi:hypothetical protein
MLSMIFLSPQASELTTLGYVLYPIVSHHGRETLMAITEY